MKKSVQQSNVCTLLKNQHSYTITDVSEKDNYYFSDLVPLCVTVDDVTDRCCWYEYQQLNPMTACKNFYEAVCSPMEKPFLHLLAGTEGTSGAHPKSAATVTFFLKFIAFAFLYPCGRMKC